VLRSRRPESRSALTAVAQLHSDGHAVDWAAFFDTSDRPPADLPTYPFQRRAYWLRGAHRATGPDMRAAQEPVPGDPAPQAGTGSPASTGAVLRIMAAPECDREALMIDLVRDHAALVLGLDGVEEIAPADSFMDLGMSSFTALELSSQLNAAGVQLSPAIIYDQPTPESLARVLLASVTDTAMTDTGVPA
jgi:acyl transferase domain-containing protein